MKDSIPDVVLCCGAGMASYGVWLAYAPAGFVVGGLFLCGFGWLLHKGK